MELPRAARPGNTSAPRPVRDRLRSRDRGRRLHVAGGAHRGAPPKGGCRGHAGVGRVGPRARPLCRRLYRSMSFREPCADLGSERCRGADDRGSGWVLEAADRRSTAARSAHERRRRQGRRGAHSTVEDPPAEGAQPPAVSPSVGGHAGIGPSAAVFRLHARCRDQRVGGDVRALTLDEPGTPAGGEVVLDADGARCRGSREARPARARGCIEILTTSRLYDTIPPRSRLGAGAGL
jgi:hypothetical protein